MAEAPLLGLILGGGQSRRMGRDKASLSYHGKPQILYTWELLEKLGIKAFVSCREDQSDAESFKGLPQIHDRFLGFGPMGGILSALSLHRESAFLVLACDLPFLDIGTLAALIRSRNPDKVATAYRGHENLPEPLCAIYEPAAYAALLGFLGQGVHCPRKSLIRSDVELLEPIDAHALANINRPEEYDTAIQTLQTR